MFATAGLFNCSCIPHHTLGVLEWFDEVYISFCKYIIFFSRVVDGGIGGIPLRRKRNSGKSALCVKGARFQVLIDMANRMAWDDYSKVAFYVA